VFQVSNIYLYQLTIVYSASELADKVIRIADSELPSTFSIRNYQRWQYWG